MHPHSSVLGILAALALATASLGASRAHALDALYVLGPDGSGGTALWRAPFDGGVNSGSLVAVLSAAPPTSFGGIHYEVASSTLYLLEPDTFGGTELRAAPFDGVALGAFSFVAPFPSGAPDDHGGLSWDSAAGLLYYFTDDGSGGTGLWSRPFDGTTLGAPSLVLTWSSTGVPSDFAGISYDAAGGQLYSFAREGGASSATTLWATLFDGATTGPGVPLGQWSPSHPANFAGISLVTEPAVGSSVVTGTLVMYDDAVGQVETYRSVTDLLVGNNTVLGNSVALGREAFTFDGTQYVAYDDADGQVETWASLPDLLAGNNTVLGNGLLGREGLAHDGSQFVMYDAETGLVETYATLADLAAGNAVALGNTPARARDALAHDGTRFILYDSDTGQLDAYATLADLVAGNGVVLGHAPPLGRTALVALPEHKLLASDGYTSDGFGSSVALAGGVVLAGAPGSDDNGGSSGSAYASRFDGTSWVEEQKLIASDGEAFDQFGWSVALAGDVAVAGAPFSDDDGSGSGSAYVYRFDGASWVEEQKLIASDAAAGDFFGFSVSLAEDVALVGAQRNDGNDSNSGSAYLYRFDGTGWVEEQKLIASDGAPYDGFGRSVALAGDIALVGARFDNDNGLA